MHLKLTVRRQQGRATNVGVTVDATALVGDLAAALYASDPAHAGRQVAPDLTLSVEERYAQGSEKTLDRERNLIEAGLRSGSVVSLVREPRHRSAAADNRGPAAALLRIVSGPDRGKEFSLPAGISHVGRLGTAEVRLHDPLVSKRHARIIVGESVEIVDANSANGLIIGGRRVTRAILGSADMVQLGDTVVTIVQTKLAGTVEPTSSAIEFNRAPRVVARFPAREFEAPEAPKPAQRQRFPLISLIAPLLMGVVLYAVSRNVLSIVFIGLSPLLMIGMWADGKLESKRQLKAAKANFEALLVAVTEEIRQAQVVERAVRGSRTPAAAEALTAVRQLGPLMWSYRPEHDEFLTVRLGVGSAPSQCTVSVGNVKDGIAEYVARLKHFKRAFDTIADVPLLGDLRTCGALGVAGQRGLVEGVARGIVLQLVGLHSPAELTITALASPLSRPTWEWLEWLPHTGSAHSPLPGVHLADNQGAAAALVSQLEDLIEARRAEQPSGTAEEGGGPLEGLAGATAPAAHTPPALPVVIVVIEDDTPMDRARLTRLAENGPCVGVHVLWVASQVASLPAVCRTFLLAESNAAGSTAGQVRQGMHSYPVVCESVDGPTAEAAALLMSPVTDAGIAVEDSSDLPAAMSWLDLAGHELGDAPDAVIERWREDGSLIERDAAGNPTAERKRRDKGDLRAIVGSAGAAPLFLDLREQGPHALVGGTTGAGKSEFLQTWVLGMAAAHGPDRVTFLFVDYKGGAAFADCVHLPHTVGLVTDLSPHLVRRALTSLRAEIRHREHLLNRKKAKDLVSLEQKGDPECPPSLIIIVDEFAALVQEVPEFVDGVVDVAQRGRSLGLHLILATQRPAGVIKDNLRANTNLRIALRMADVDDSNDVLGVPDAAHFAPNIPGRAAAKTGPGRLTTFQTGYLGGWTTGEVEAPPIAIEELRFGSPLVWEPPLAEDGDEDQDRGPADITRVVGTLRAAARRALVPEPRKPWLPVLKDTYDVRDLVVSRTDTRLLLGVGDDAEQQQQPIVYYEPDRDGNMAIFGASGAGKSAALRQLAVASAITFRGGPVCCYGLDFGSAGLRMIEGLPHVGAVIDGEDEERIARLMRRLVATVDERAQRYAAANASTITEYRARADRPDEARILVLVDGIGAFRDAYEHSVISPWFTMFSQLATDGRAVGVHVVVTADRPNALPTSLGSTIQRRIVLRLATEDDYMMLGVAKDILTAASPPGRGVIDGRELQIAVLGGQPNVSVQAREIARLAEDMRAHGSAEAPTVERLPDSVRLSVLPVAAGTSADGRPLPTLGMGDTTLCEEGFEAAGAFMLAGPPASGRSTALLAMAQAVERATPTCRRILLSPRATPLAAHAWSLTAVGPDDVAELARKITSAVQDGSVGADGIAVFIDSLTAFNAGPAEMDLAAMIKCVTGEGHLVVGEGEVSTWSQAWTLAQPFKSGRRGLLLVPGDMDGDTLLSTPLGRIRRKDFPPGRGFVVNAGKAVKLQVAMPAV